MTWEELYPILNDCLDVQICQHGPHRIETILLGPKEVGAYWYEIQKIAVCGGQPFSTNSFFGKLVPYRGYPVCKMQHPGVAVRINKSKGLVILDEIDYWPTP